MGIKQYRKQNVLEASKERIKNIFDDFNRIYVSFSGGKDSTVMLHLVMEEAIKRNRKVGVMLIDLEGQYDVTINHLKTCYEKYKENIEKYWICLPISLRNAVSNYEPRWICWDDDVKDAWIRELPDGCIHDINYFPFFRKGMEFEEFVPEFGEWFGKGEKTACFVGIRTDESLNRFRTIQNGRKIKWKDMSCTTQITDNVYNVYPIYDWKVSDLWHWHYLNPDKEYNKLYDYMHKAGLTPSQMRICQPYGDDQRRGLWLFHILEPQTWFKVVARVNGANSGALYINETGNINGYNRISKPNQHTWHSFANLLLKSLPKKTQEHYLQKFKVYLTWWHKRGYSQGIPDEAPYILEAKKIVPSWRRVCKCLLRNDWWCKGLCFTQPKSEAYGRYLQMKEHRKEIE